MKKRITGRRLFQGDNYKEIIKLNKACEVDFSFCSHASEDGNMMFISRFKQKNEIQFKAVDLLKHMLEKQPEKRISSKQALKHHYFNILIGQECVNEKPINSNSMFLGKEISTEPEFLNDFKEMLGILLYEILSSFSLGKQKMKIYQLLSISLY